MSSSPHWIWVDGEILESQRPVLPAESRGVIYGAGCFETFRIDGYRVRDLDRHLERLQRGLDWLGASSCRPSRSLIGPVLAELLEKNGIGERSAVARIQASLGGGRGYSSPERLPVYLIVSVRPAAPRPASIRLASVGARVVPAACRPADLKLSNTLHYMQGWREANRAGGDDALMLTLGGDVAETSMANLFWMKGEVVRTPSVDCDILPGIVRSRVIGLLEEEKDVILRSGRFTPDSLLDADLVWVTNSVKGIVPVTGIDGHRFPAGGEILKRLDRRLGKIGTVRLPQ